MEPHMSIQIGSNVPLRMTSIKRPKEPSPEDIYLPLGQSNTISVPSAKFQNEEQNRTRKIISRQNSGAEHRTCIPLTDNDDSPLFSSCINLDGLDSKISNISFFNNQKSSDRENKTESVTYEAVNNNPGNNRAAMVSETPLSMEFINYRSKKVNPNDSLYESCSEDSNSLKSDAGHQNLSNDFDSAFSNTSEGNDELCGFTWVAMTSQKDIACMLHVTFESELTANNEEFRKFVVELAIACRSYFVKKSGMEGSLNADQLLCLILSDRRTTKQHLKELIASLHDNVALMEAVCERANTALFIGTFVNDPIFSMERVTVGKSGVLSKLRKVNKFAPVIEFSDQLNHHIIYHHPQRLRPDKNENCICKKESEDIRTCPCLLSQPFLYDPTITVSIAAQRSFIEIMKFYHKR